MNADFDVVHPSEIDTANDDQPVDLPTVSEPCDPSGCRVSTAPPHHSLPLPPVFTDRSSFAPILLSELDETAEQGYSASNASVSSSKLSTSSLQHESSTASLSPPNSNAPFSQTSLAE